MKKYIITMIMAMFVFIVLLPASAFAQDEENRVEIQSDGSVILYDSQASAKAVSSLELSFQVESEITGAAFSFFDEVKSDAKIVEYRYHEDGQILNIYIAGTEPLFKESGLKLGTITDEYGGALIADVSVVADSLKYVEGTALVAPINMNYPEAATTITGVTSGSSDDPSEAEPSESEPPEEEPGTGEKEEDLLLKLRDALDTAKQYPREKYTEESYQALLNAISNAEALLVDPNATPEGIKQAIMDLENAIGALIPVNENVSDNPPAIEENSGIDGTLQENENNNSNNNTDSVATGDNFPVIPVIIAVVVSGIILLDVLIVMVFKKKSKNKQPKDQK